MSDSVAESDRKTELIIDYVGNWTYKYIFTSRFYCYIISSMVELPMAQMIDSPMARMFTARKETGCTGNQFPTPNQRITLAIQTQCNETASSRIYWEISEEGSKTPYQALSVNWNAAGFDGWVYLDDDISKQIATVEEAIVGLSKFAVETEGRISMELNVEENKPMDVTLN